MSLPTSNHVIYRVDDDVELDLATAMHRWAPVAYEALKTAATQYKSTISHQELANVIIEETGIDTEMPMNLLVTKVMEICAAQAARENEPPLTSLCVKEDGTMPAAYARQARSAQVTAVEQATGTTLADLDNDLDMYAAHHRLMCYRTHASNVPASAQPLLPDDLAQRRGRAAARAEKQKAAARAEAPRPVCMSCFTQLPASGICQQCDF